MKNHKYDLLLRRGRLVDPAHDLDKQLDIAFRAGKIAAVGQLEAIDSVEVIDVGGAIVAPGLIDLHGHFAYKISPYGADPDRTCLQTGVSTGVDAGSLGWISFPAFRSYVIERAATRLFAFLHLSALGTVPVATGIPDLMDLRFVDLDKTQACLGENRDVLVGVKVRLCPTGAGVREAVPALELARQVATESGTRVMVHVMDSPLPLSSVFDLLKPGDIVTHIFHGTEHNVLDKSGRVRKQVWEAYTNGILFDTACFTRHFSIPICRAAMDEGLLPHSLSTDWVGPWMGVRNYSLIQLMSFFMAIGMSLKDTIRAVTATPAKVLGRENLGTLRVGSEGDATVLRLEDLEYVFEDGLGNKLTATKQFELEAVVRSGARWTPPEHQRVIN